MDFNTLLRLPRMGVVVLLHETHKRVAVYPTSNVLATVTNVITRIKNNDLPDEMLNDAEQLSASLYYLDEFINPKLLLHLGYLTYKEYLDQGYTFYLPPRVVKYQPKILPIRRDNHIYGVFLVNNQKQKILIEKFKTANEAKAFIVANSILEMLTLYSKNEHHL